MSTITIDSKIFQEAEMYAKKHNVSLRQMVEKYLAKFQVSTCSLTASEGDAEKEPCTQENELLDGLSPSLMKGLAEYAVREHRSGHCLTQEQVENSIMEEMRWN